MVIESPFQTWLCWKIFRSNFVLQINIWNWHALICTGTKRHNAMKLVEGTPLGAFDHMTLHFNSWRDSTWHSRCSAGAAYIAAWLAFLCERRRRLLFLCPRLHLPLCCCCIASRARRQWLFTEKEGDSGQGHGGPCVWVAVYLTCTVRAWQAFLCPKNKSMKEKVHMEESPLPPLRSRS